MISKTQNMEVKRILSIFIQFTQNYCMNNEFFIVGFITGYAKLITYNDLCIWKT
jgi:hypothetical protein